MPVSLEQFRAAATALNDVQKPGENVTLRFNEFGGGIATSGWERFQVSFFDLFRDKGTIVLEKAKTVQAFLDAVAAEADSVSEFLVVPQCHLADFSVRYSPGSDQGTKLKARAAAEAIQEMSDHRAQWLRDVDADAWALADTREQSILRDRERVGSNVTRSETLLATPAGIQYRREKSAAPHAEVRKAEATFGRAVPEGKAASLEEIVQDAFDSLGPDFSKSGLLSKDALHALQEKYKDPAAGALDEMRAAITNYAEDPVVLGEASEYQVFDPETLKNPRPDRQKIVSDGPRYQACRRIVEGFIVRDFNRCALESFLKKYSLTEALRTASSGKPNGEKRWEEKENLIRNLAAIENDKLNAPSVVGLKPERMGPRLNSARKDFVDAVGARFDALRAIDGLEVAEAFKIAMMSECLDASEEFCADGSFVPLMTGYALALAAFAEAISKAPGKAVLKESFLALVTELDRQYAKSLEKEAAEPANNRPGQRGNPAIRLGLMLFAARPAPASRDALRGWIDSEAFEALKTEINGEGLKRHDRGTLKAVSEETQFLRRQLIVLDRLEESLDSLSFAAQK